MRPSHAFFFAPETCARVTLTALAVTGAPFEPRVIAFLAGDHRRPEFLAVSPGGKVPALLTPDGPLTQNVAILTYLHAQFPQAGLLPERADALGRAQVLAELLRCSSDLHPLVSRFVLPQFQTTDAGSRRGVRAKAQEVLRDQLMPLESRLASQPWMLAEGWSIIDDYLAWIWFRITGAGFDAGGFPAIAAHHDATIARPGAQAALAQERAAQADLAARGLQFRAPSPNFHAATQGRP